MIAEQHNGGTLDGCFRVRREIARGGICVILEAEQVLTGRVVAIKTLNDEQVRRESSKLRLLREAKVLETCRHPNVVEILHAAVDPSGAPYLAMEMIEGKTLSGLLAARQSLPVDDTMAIVCQLCSALAHAHARGIVHRDVKPSNILISRDQTGAEIVKLLDFGIARLTGTAAGPAEPKITKLGEMIGTAEYMAPEQYLMSDDVDCRSDIYAVAVVMFECLSGSVPFAGDFGEVILQVTQGPIPSIRSRCPTIDGALDALLLRAMAVEREARYPDMNAFIAALAAVRGESGLRTNLLGAATPAESPAKGASNCRPIAPGTAPDFKQRRRFVRQPFVAPVHMVTASGVIYDGHSEDISEGGMLVMIDRACESTQAATVKFAMPMSGRIVKAHATTRWVKGARGRAAAGLEFEGLDDELRKEIAAYVALMGRMGRA